MISEENDRELVPALHEAVYVVDVGEEIVLWNGIRRDAHVLDSMSAALLPYFDGATRVDEVVSDVVDVFGVSRKDAQTTIRRLIENLSALGVVADASG